MSVVLERMSALALLVGRCGEVDREGVLHAAPVTLPRLAGQAGSADRLLEGDRRRQRHRGRGDVQEAGAHGPTASGALST